MSSNGCPAIFFFCIAYTVVSGGEHVDVIIGAAVADGKVTPKVQSLIKILLKYQHTEDFRAIVFVERVVAALVLPKVEDLEGLCLNTFTRTCLLKSFYYVTVSHSDVFLSASEQVFSELPSLSFIKSASLIGHNNNQEMRTCQMQDAIAKFRDGRVCFKSCFVINSMVGASLTFLISEPDAII